MTAARRLAFIAIFVSVAWTTGPRLIEQARKAFDLRPVPIVERRKQMFGPMYESILRIDRTRRAGERLAVIGAPGPDLDAALFFNYYIYPRAAKVYVNLDAYRLDRTRPPTIVFIDLTRSAEARVMSYQQARAEVIGSKHVVFAPSPDPTPVSHFVVPLVSSGDGPVPDMYTTEVAMENAGSEIARVNVQIFPSSRGAVIELQPGERRTWADFVEQVFGTMEVGWLRVQSNQPLRVRFWFVNRGVRDADVLRFAKFFRRVTMSVPLKARLWVLNPHDRELPVKLNGGDHRLPARSLIPLEWVGEVHLEAADDWYAFVSWRDHEGNTRFIWPEVTR